jgi:hypothetical protein
MEETDITFTMNERSIRALHSAVVFTLDKWTGQGELDQDCLIGIKSSLQGCLFEFNFDRSPEA